MPTGQMQPGRAWPRLTDMLWAALFFPQLHLDSLGNNGDILSAHEASNPDQAEQPLVVIIQESSRRLVMSSNGPARDIGIYPGLTLNGAYAIAPDLKVIDYDEHTQQQHLEHLSLWALQYSSWITPQMPNLILIEIEASLKLFGGLESLVTRLRADIQTQGLLMQLGIAPTPAAARLFACIGGRTGVLKKERLRSVLGSMETQYLPLDEFTLKGLRQSGIKHCDQLFNLPATALTRRFGQPCTDLIYKLLGKLPEVCPAFTIPDTFSRRLDLPLEAPDVNALQFPLNRLLSALGGFLKTNDLGVKTLIVELLHHRVEATKVTLRFLEATANHKHLFKVISERLSNTALAASAIAVTITTQELASVTRDDRDLFQKSQNQQSSIRQLVDNLAARLGSDKLYTPMLSDDHRPEKAYPEKAWCSELKSQQTPPSDWPARPVWLLPEPVRVNQSPNQLLRIKSTAERIENGWWGKSDVRRDYFIAADQHGAHFWVYRNRSAPGELFIHGIFS